MKHCSIAGVTALISTMGASPAFAHADAHFHTHGIENYLVLALIAAAIGVFTLTR